jgi:predicted ATPase
MRLDRVYIDGFKNLRAANVDFDESRLTTVVIGQNGAGKSNLIEAIVDVFRFADLNRGVPRYRYEIDYRLGGHRIRLSNLEGSPSISCDGEKISRAAFERDRAAYFPDLVFGYYSGGSRRLEQLFDSHQRRYYDDVKLNEDPEDCRRALGERRLFYCRPIHGIFALLASLAFPNRRVSALLKEKLGVSEFHSALAVFREPWFAKSRKKKALADAHELWGAKGPAGACARAMRDQAFCPIAIEDRPIDDYRDKGITEPQLGAFLRNLTALKKLTESYENDREFFAALEAMDISDLIRDLHVWVTRPDDQSGDVSFSDLSDGERQLLMALGLIRISRGKRALFLLDEPDTHLNPHWQHSYLELIHEWTEIAAEESLCHIVMTSHNPLTIASLDREEVRVISLGENGKTQILPPYIAPKGMGFTSTLTEIFGLATSVDSETQRDLDERNMLARIDKRTKDQDRMLIEINDKLARLGFMFEDREPLYNEFLKALKDFRYADRPPLNPAQVEERRKAMNLLVRSLAANQAS